MKRFVAVLVTLILVAPAMAMESEWDLYGSARVSMFWVNKDEDANDGINAFGPGSELFPVFGHRLIDIWKCGVKQDSFNIGEPFLESFFNVCSNRNGRTFEVGKKSDFFPCQRIQSG